MLTWPGGLAEPRQALEVEFLRIRTDIETAFEAAVDLRCGGNERGLEGGPGRAD